MKTAFSIIVILALLASPAFAEQKNPPMSLALFGYTASTMILLDTALTYDWIHNFGGEEESLFWRGLIKQPAIVITLDIGACLGLTTGMRQLYKYSRFMAYVIPIAVIAIESVALYEHLRARADWRGPTHSQAYR